MAHYASLVNLLSKKPVSVDSLGARAAWLLELADALDEIDFGEDAEMARDEARGLIRDAVEQVGATSTPAPRTAAPKTVDTSVAAPMAAL